MKKFIVLSLLFLLPATATFSQNWEWAKRTGGTFFHTRGNAVAKDAAGNAYYAGGFTDTIVIGSFTLISNTSDDSYLAKFDAAGNCLWAIDAVYGSGTQEVIDVHVDGTGNIYLAGRYSGGSAKCGSYTVSNWGGGDAFLAKLNSSGACLWLRSATDTYDQAGVSVTTDSKNNVILGGIFTNGISFGSGVSLIGNSFSSDGFVAKYSPSGTIRWAKKFSGTTTTADDATRAVACNAADEIYAAGYFENGGVLGSCSVGGTGSSSVFLSKLDTSGNCIWARSAGGSGGDAAYGLGLDAAGNVYITGVYGQTAIFGSYSITSSGGNDVFIAKYTPAGTCTWVKSGGSTGNDKAEGLATDPQGNCYIAGYYYGTAQFGNATLAYSGMADSYVAKCDSGGNFGWALKAGGTMSEFPHAIAVHQNHVYVTGEFTDTCLFGGLQLAAFGFANSAFLCKINTNITTSAGQFSMAVKQVFVYPNPATNHIRVAGSGTARIYDLHGKELLTVNLDETEGVMQIAHLTAGMYLVQVVTEQGISTGRFIKN